MSASVALTSLGVRGTVIWHPRGHVELLAQSSGHCTSRRGASAPPGRGWLQQRRSTALACSFFSLRRQSEPPFAAAVARRSQERNTPTLWAQRGTPWPNPSVEARPNGRTPGPPPGRAYHPSGGPGALPSAPPHL